MKRHPSWRSLHCRARQTDLPRPDESPAHRYVDQQGLFLMDVYLEFAARGRNGWWRYPLCLVVACVLAGLILLVLGVALALIRQLPADIATQIQQPKDTIPFFLGIAVSFAACTVGLALSAMLVHRNHPRELN